MQSCEGIELFRNKAEHLIWYLSTNAKHPCELSYITTTNCEALSTFMTLNEGSHQFSHCLFVGNTASSDKVGMVVYTDVNVAFTDCSFIFPSLHSREFMNGAKTSFNRCNIKNFDTSGASVSNSVGQVPDNSFINLNTMLQEIFVKPKNEMKPRAILAILFGLSFPINTINSCLSELISNKEYINR